MENTGTLSRQQLLVLALDHGYQLSATQLARWHRAGLIPRPKQQAKGRARGSTSLYPLATGEQLLLLCALRKQERRLCSLAWQLWWAGYPVAMHLIRRQLQQRATRLCRRIDELMLLSGLAESGEDLIDYLEAYAETTLSSGPLRRVRKRVGRQHFPTFLRLLIGIASGSFPFDEDASDREEVREDLNILGRGLLLSDTCLQDQATIDEYMKRVGLPLLRWLNSWFSTLPWMQALSAASDFELMQVRDDLRFFLKRFDPLLLSKFAPARGKPVWGDALSSIMTSLSGDDQALLLLMGLALRQPSEF